jgi:hypothetical protein
MQVTNYSDALLLPIEVISKYNMRIKELGREKIAVLSKIKQFRRKINLIDWQVCICVCMYVCMYVYVCVCVCVYVCVCIKQFRRKINLIDWQVCIGVVSVYIQYDCVYYCLAVQTQDQSY